MPTTGNLGTGSLLPTDPPIIVGGGGSTYVWIKKDIAEPVADPTALPHQPGTPKDPDQYVCYKLPNFNVGAIHYHDGNAAHGPEHPQNNKHFTYFD